MLIVCVTLKGWYDHGVVNRSLVLSSKRSEDSSSSLYELLRISRARQEDSYASWWNIHSFVETTHGYKRFVLAISELMEKLVPLFFALLSRKLVLDDLPLVQHVLYAMDLMWRTIDQCVLDLANRIENPEKLSEFVFSINYNALSLECEQFDDSISFLDFFC